MPRLINSGIANGESINYFGKLRRVLKIFGLSLTGDDSTAYKIYSFFIYSTMIVGYLLLNATQLYKSGSTDDVLIMFFFPYLLADIKAIFIWTRRIKFGKLLDKMEQAPFTPNIDRGGEAEEKLIEKCVWMINAQTYVYWINASFTILAIFGVAVIERIRSNDYHDWKFPVGTFDLLNVTYSPNYEICLSIQTATAIVCAALFSTIDLITAAVLAHMTFQFQVLQNNLKRIIHISYKRTLKDNQLEDSAVAANDNSPAITWKNLKNSLSDVVTYHLAIIGIAEEVESIFKSMFLMEYLMTVGIICFSTYQASKVTLTDPSLAGSTEAAIITCFQILIFSYWGEQVSFESQEVGRAAFEVDFTGTDPRFQKALTFIIRRSQNPTRITINKFAVVGLQTWLWIVRASYSGFMMLRNLQN